MSWLPLTLPAWLIALSLYPSLAQTPPESSAENPVKRVVIFEIDGLGADLLYRNMRDIDPATGKPRLPWFSHIFAENGAVFDNFYTRGLSLSAPSWSMLDTGYHTVIRGNVEYDRFTGHVYDYLNFFPLYLGYARRKQVDMPGVTVLDRAGIPLLIDSFPFDQTFQSFQLFQKGVRWTTLRNVVERRFSSKTLFATVENGTSPSLAQLLSEQTEHELLAILRRPEILYLDFFSGDIDHEGHATNMPTALLDSLRQADALAGRIWAAIQVSPLAKNTLFITVSDHGMNNTPGVYSQSFSVPDLLNSEAGGAHHVITNRPQLADYKIRGLNPLVERVTTPSTASFYLKGQADRYPTAWLDLDGNERAAIQLRNSDLNKIHILLQQLAREDISFDIRKAAADCLRRTIDSHRALWTQRIKSMTEELGAVRNAIELRRPVILAEPKSFTHEQAQTGEDRQVLRLRKEYEDWGREHEEYSNYLSHLRALLDFEPDEKHPFRGKISELVPPMMLGDSSTAWELRHYVAGPAPGGFVLTENGELDEERSFRRIDYLALLATQRVRNNPQPVLSPQPIDFAAVRLPPVSLAGVPGPVNVYWLYRSQEKQLIILTDGTGQILVKPACVQLDEGQNTAWADAAWQPGLPMNLFEDPNLHVPAGQSRITWLSQWHTEREWFEAIHECRYSNGVIGIVEELSPVGDNVLPASQIDPLMLRYERLRRELVQPDLQVFAADHWNFNVRNFNPGGNHGSFLRISTHSAWMMTGPGIPVKSITDPYDSLNFASTILTLLGKKPPMPDRVVRFQ